MDYLDPSDIQVLPDRQRKEADPSGLVESIRRFGIINPIVVDEDNVLIAGERRLRAALELGLDVVPVRYLSDLDETERQVIELEENLSRKDLSWQEEIEAVRRIWELRGKPKQKDLGEYLGKSESWVNERLQAAKVVESQPDLKEAPSLRNALNTAKRRERRKLTLDLAEAMPAITGAEEPKEASAGKIICADFTEWAAKTDEKFNFIHVDFPYGVNLDKSGIKAGYSTKTYEDSEDTYFKLLEAFVRNADKFALPDCHVIWWLSNKYREETIAALAAIGFEAWRDPLIWCYGANVGIAADPQRFPRHSYETAILFHRGDRPLVKLGWDSYVLNPQTIDRTHPSEKPREMLKHFFKMFIDGTSLVLDPTCGSGNSIAVAIELGAMKAIGIEMDQEYAKIAEENLNA